MRMRGLMLVPLLLACAWSFPDGGPRGRSEEAYAPASQDSMLLRDAARLIHASPALWPSRNVAAEATFVGQVRAVARRAGRRPEEVRSVDDAMAVLESIAEQRIAQVHVTSPRRGLAVQMRRWAYRNNANARWNELWADTLVRRPAVLYQFRYRPPAAERDTVVNISCADDCDVRLP